MRVALVHDWLVTYGGAERVLEEMLHCYPDADLYCLADFLPANQRDFVLNKPATTSFIQKLPRARSKYRSYLPLMPLAIEQFDLSGYDLVISSSHAVAKGVLTGPDQVHVCMCYSPMRYAWDLQHQYLAESGLQRGLKGWLAKWILHKMRIWDVRTSHGVDVFISISKFIARRVHKVYGRKSVVIYPPVDSTGFSLGAASDREEFYLTASRMVPYKKIDLIVEAFTTMPDKKLIVIGAGPDFQKIKDKAGPNVELLGYQPFSVLREHLQRAKAFVFAPEEDFGIAPLEAQACGTPVLAYGKGAALETIRGLDVAQQPTGVFFEAQSVESICSTVATFEARQAEISAEACRENAMRFRPERFRREFEALITAAMERDDEQAIDPLPNIERQ